MKLQELASAVSYIFDKTVKKVDSQNVSFCFVGYYPERFGIARDVVKAGGKAFIVGGQDGVKAVPDVPQYGLPYDTTGLSLEYKTTRAIVNAIPANEIENKKIALSVYPPLGTQWSQAVHERHLNTDIVVSNEQNLGLLFEEKGYLAQVLRYAGLDEYMIPSEIVHPGLSVKNAREMYKALKGKNDKIVVQDCFAFAAGGKGTVIANDEYEFVHEVTNQTGITKVATFVEGPNGNLTACGFNLKPCDSGFGGIRSSVDESQRTALSMEKMRGMAESFGINNVNTVGVVTRATLKAVGDPNLTSLLTNGVGNSLGYVYDEALRSQIGQIGYKLAKTSALVGGVSLLGADLIMGEDGKVKINEINYRQQGPTDKIGRDGEMNGLPAIQKIAFIAQFGDMRDPETMQVLNMVNEHSAEISHAYATSPGRFYLKVGSLHENGYVSPQGEITQGLYRVTNQGSDNRWSWEKIGSPTENLQQYGNQSPSNGAVIIKLTGGEITQDTQVQPQRQICRLEGLTESNASPIVITGNKSRLSTDWKPLVVSFYDNLFGSEYKYTNPLLNVELKS